MNTILSFQVVPSLPPALKGLEEIAYNLAFDWNDGARALFAQLGGDQWESSHHNPVKVLGTLPQKNLEEAANDEGLLNEIERLREALRAYLEEPRWFQKKFGSDGAVGLRIAYFSMEFGLTESIPNYSGGLGILAGDHLKSASDLGLPLVGVGLLYQDGYFRQYLSADGWQQERYPANDFHNMSIALERDPAGNPFLVEVEYPDGVVRAQCWRIQVGRVPLYLLDANRPENPPPMREITHTLYGGDMETRIRQEILLGLGGVRLLHALGIPPVSCHMNEGHSAFLALERMRLVKEKHGLPIEAARELVTAGNIFTTHTPVPAGIDIFPADLMKKYFGPYAESLGMSWPDFMGLGRMDPGNESEPFNMAILAIRLSSGRNAVSRLHGEVSRRMWQNLWGQVPEKEIPISSITNGVHLPSWVSAEMKSLLNRYLGPRWASEPEDASAWERVDKIPATELWRTKERARERLVAFCRQHLSTHWRQRGLPQSKIDLANEILDPAALTIGFGRRFAPYKRAALILNRHDRLTALLADKQRPLQLVFAGKAHPRDHEGKELIREIINFARGKEVRKRVVFLEDYDIHIARMMVQGVDVWLNNPRRPQEASGTSGMKAAANGALNLSVLDGWWAEGYNSESGWAIGRGEEYQNPEYQDQVESNDLADLLEQEVIPLFYERSSDGIPRGWVARMRASMKTLCPVFNTNRMVREYAERFYLPAARRHSYLLADGGGAAKSLSDWKRRVVAAWPSVRVENISLNQNGPVPVGTPLRVQAEVELSGLSPDDVRVELYQGALDANHQITDGRTEAMSMEAQLEGSRYRYQGEIVCETSGLRGVSIRVLPAHADLSNPLDMQLLVWG